MLYNVHLRPELNIKVINIEADSQLDAIHKAETLVWDRDSNIVEAMRNALSRMYLQDKVEYIDVSEDMYNALVDRQGDTNFLESTWYNCEDKPGWEPRFPDQEKEAKRLKMLSTALTQFIENNEDTENENEKQKIAVATEELGKVNEKLLKIITKP